jgi:hypothetical protein
VYPPTITDVDGSQLLAEGSVSNVYHLKNNIKKKTSLLTSHIYGSAFGAPFYPDLSITFVDLNWTTSVDPYNSNDTSIYMVYPPGIGTNILPLLFYYNFFYLRTY